MSYSAADTCSGCGAAKCALTVHPLLDVPVCSKCSFEYHSGEFTINEESGNEIYCRWCGEGTGSLILCDSCPMSFCSGCIQRNFGLAEITRISALEERWSCFVCSPQLLEDLIENNGWNTSNRQLSQKKRKVSNLPYIICPDVSRGRERFPIPVFNDVDNEPAPLDFTYVTKHIAGEGVTISNNPSFISCCSCKDNCKDATKCECAILMGGFAYSKNGIYGVEKPEGVYECNQRCPCHLMRCKNRVVGKGPALKLQVFRCSASKGWGVRCTTDIPAGTYIADYLGEVMLESLADSRGLSGCDEYFFNLDAWGRSQACLKLSDLGLKKGLLSIPLEHEVDVSTLTKTEVTDLLGEELTEFLDQAGALDRALAANRGEVCQPCKTGQIGQTGTITGQMGTIIPVVSDSSSSSTDSVYSRPSSSFTSASSVAYENYKNYKSQKMSDKYDRVLNDKSSWWSGRRASRLKAWQRATDIISDRAITETEENNDTFTVDARYFGSVARFLNHSCSPNLDTVTVMVDSHDVRIPRVAFFSSGSIPAMTELCYDYGYFEGNVDGKSRKCLCDAKKCRNVLY